MTNSMRIILFACLVFTVCSVPIKEDKEVMEQAVKDAVTVQLLGDAEGKPIITKKDMKNEKMTEELAAEHEHLVQEEEESEAQPLRDEEESEEESEAQPLRDEEESEEESEAQPLRDEEESEEESEAQPLRDEEESEEEAEAQPLRDEEESEEESEAQPLKNEKTRSVEEESEEESEAQPLRDEEESEEESEAQPLRDEEESEEESEAQPLRDEEESEEEAEAQPLRDEEESEEEAEAQPLKHEEVEDEMMVKDLDRDEEPIEKEIVDTEREMKKENPCMTANFKYYQPHPTEPTKYYQCDPWGSFVIHTCDKGFFWDRWTLKCQMKENIRNLTSIIPEPVRKMSLFNCTVSEHECRNGGKCIEKDDEFMCECPEDFTGLVCEISTKDMEMFNNIMKGNVTLKEYAAKLVEESADMDMHYYKKYEKVLNKETYEKMMGYLRRYKDGLVRYDILVNSLVEDLLIDVYPDAEFLRTFNISSKHVLTVVRLIPNLLSYAKYSAERYEEVFVQYQAVLEELYTYLNVSCKNMSKEAFIYSELTQLFLNDKNTKKMEKQEVVHKPREEMKIFGRRFYRDELKSEEIVKKTIKTDFDMTLEKTYKLFKLLVTFEKAVAQEYKVDPEFIHKPLVETHLPGVEKVITLFNEIQRANVEIWESLVSYGFWYITNMFIAPTPVVEAQME